MIAVTGALGFIGSNLVHALVGRGCEVLAVDLPEALGRPYLDGLDGVRVVTRDRFHRWLDEADPAVTGLEAIFHQGACSDTTETRAEVLDALNTRDTWRIVQFAQQRRIPLIYASSAAVYGPLTGWREAPEYERPLNLYAVSKKRIDDRVRAEIPAPTAQLVGLRYFNVYGPREDHKGRMASVAHKMWHQLQASGEVTLFGPSHGYAAGEQRRDFVYVGDVVAVNLWFLDHPEVSGIFNVGTGRAEPFNAVARAVLDHAGRGTLRYIPFPDDLRDQYQAFTQADLSRLRAAGCELTFLPVADGVRATLDQLARR